MVAIEFQRVSKKYRRRKERSLRTTLKSFFLHDLWRLKGQPVEIVWALRNVDLVMERGRTVGIIGRNGSGKTTALKIMSKILKPDEGAVVVDGRVAALLELGAGFHPELSGRENVIINGMIMGLTKREIRDKLDEIVEFAELREYMHDAVRTYSSGMYMRLGFSVAVHVDPEILLIDEVLAVGDAAFTQKCIERMNKFKAAGNTIVVATHDLKLVRSWCDDAIWLDGGLVKMKGKPQLVVDAYQDQVFGSVQRRAGASE